MSLPLTALAYFSLSLLIISPWVKRSPWVWGPFLIFAFALGYLAKIVHPVALLPVGGLLILHTLLKGDIRGLARFILVTLTFAISLGLALHIFPGFSNIQVLKKTVLSQGALPFSLYLNFDKPFIGIFVLALGFPLIKDMRDLSRLLKLVIPLTLAGIIVLVTLALTSGLVRWDPKLPSTFYIFAIQNLLFVTIVEEAFWRGFVQKEFFRWFGEKGLAANAGAILITALLFAGLHYFWLQNIPFLGLIFVAGLIYGSLFQLTKAIEASIFCHWTFNLTHFFLLTYPALS